MLGHLGDAIATTLLQDWTKAGEDSAMTDKVLRERPSRPSRPMIVTGAVLVVVLAAALIILAPGDEPPPAPAALPIDDSEHARTIEALRPPKRSRPVIAIVALNESTEVTDLLVPFGVLMRADVADVSVIAERIEAVPLHPFSAFGRGPELMSIEPQSTLHAFEERYPDGADYVLVPALMPRDDPAVMAWIVAQHRKGAKVFSVCAGSLTLAAAGLLEHRRATTHWAYVSDLQEKHPTMRWIADRRYVADAGISTSTGITATIPVTIALVEAIAGRPKAERLAQELGVEYWDARHRSSEFQLTWEHRKTFVRNWISFWRRETVGVPIKQGVDEIALALTLDSYSRTIISTPVTVGGGGEPVRSRHGLVIRPTTSETTSAVDRVLPPPHSDSPALTLERELGQIASRFGRPTARIVALQMEHTWTAGAQR
jgi:putative intracellular protease/amidase